MNRWTVFLTAFTWLGCGGDNAKAITDGAVAGPDAPDEDPPVIEHEPIDSAQPINREVGIDAIVTDELSVIDTVAVIYKRHDVETWSSSLLEESDAATSTWSGVIPGPDVNGSNVFYFIHAIDSAGNESFFPPDGEANPASFRVNPDA
jgi:hypothetical protein